MPCSASHAESAVRVKNCLLSQRTDGSANFFAIEGWLARKEFHEIPSCARYCLSPAAVVKPMPSHTRTGETASVRTGPGFEAVLVPVRIATAGGCSFAQAA